MVLAVIEVLVMDYQRYVLGPLEEEAVVGLRTCVRRDQAQRFASTTDRMNRLSLVAHYPEAHCCLGEEKQVQLKRVVIFSCLMNQICR